MKYFISLKNLGDILNYFIINDQIMIVIYSIYTIAIVYNND